MATKTKINTYNPALAVLLLRLGLAFVFIYAAVDAFRHPDAWIYFIPQFTTHLVDAKTSLDIVSVVQLVVAALLIAGKWLKLTALVAATLLFGIIVFNFSSMIVVFRDIGLLAAVLALILLDKS